MGKIKNTEINVNDIVGNIASDSWYDMMDVISDTKEENMQMAYEAVESYLEDEGIDVDDWEAVIGESLSEYIEEAFYAEWEI